jgi:hypothetical protein
MFTSYETPVPNIAYPPFRGPEAQKGTKLLTNIKGEALGVQVEYSSPLQLYFHLENVCEIPAQELLASTVLFEILTTTHKVLVSREFQTSEILNQSTNDLYVFINSEDLKTLKKETYNMRVTLKTAADNFVVFAEKDGYLVLR